MATAKKIRVTTIPTMADKVRQATKDNPGKTAADIAALIGTKTQYVHSVWYLDRKKGSKAAVRRMGRPRKVATDVAKQEQIKPVINPVTIDVIKKFNASAADERIKRLEDQVKDMKTVIRYLEGRVYGASI